MQAAGELEIIPDRSNKETLINYYANGIISMKSGITERLPMDRVLFNRW